MQGVHGSIMLSASCEKSDALLCSYQLAAASFARELRVFRVRGGGGQDAQKLMHMWLCAQGSLGSSVPTAARRL